MNDEWAAEVLARLNTAPSDLQHKPLDKKQMPKSQKTDDTRISGTPERPNKSKTEQAFLQMVK